MEPTDGCRVSSAKTVKAIRFRWVGLAWTAAVNVSMNSLILVSYVALRRMKSS